MRRPPATTIALAAATLALAAVTILALSGTILSRTIEIEGTRGGTIEVLYTNPELPDLDPARAQELEVTPLLRAMLRTPYTWRPDRPLAAVPDLAEGVPEITEGGRRVTVHLRPGVRFAPPVDREVVAADVAYAISRAFRPSVQGAGARQWFGAVTGIDAVRRGEAEIASGLRTPDDRTLVIELDRPVGRTVAEALALEIAAPVPREYAAPFDAEPESTYGEHLVATGPYRLAADADGRLKPPVDGRLTLERNPSWDPATDERPAFADRFVVRLGSGHPDAVITAALDGPAAVAADALPTSEAIIGPGRRDQVQVGRVGSVAFLAFNTSVPPLDDVAVRQAAVAAADRETLNASLGGASPGELATHWIPPGIPGFDQAGGRAGPDLPWLAAPAGDLEVARSILREAGYADGRHDGSGRIEIAVPAGSEIEGLTEDYAERLRALGLRVAVRGLGLVAYRRACSGRDPAGPSCYIAWQPELRDAEAVLAPLFAAGTGAEKLSRLDDPEIDEAMREAGELQGSGDRARAWGDIDRQVTALAPGVPVEWGTDLNVRSADVQGYLDPATGAWALPYLSLEP